MSDSNTGFFHVGDVLPIESVDNLYGMTARQYAAVNLRAPDSGADWLDEMITKSLRDEFAAKAMQGILADNWGGYTEQIAIDAYQMADAMLEARKCTN